jgi:hypothetical protein
MATPMTWPPLPAPQTEDDRPLEDLVRELDREDLVIQVLVALALAAALALALLTLGAQLSA